MGYFDFLIDKNNVDAELDKEYVYLHDMVWKHNDLKSYPVQYGTIVHSVCKLENNSFEFKIGTDKQVYCTNYGWALAVKTDKNLKAIEAYNLLKQKLQIIKKETEVLRKNIDTLNKSAVSDRTELLFCEKCRGNKLVPFEKEYGCWDCGHYQVK